MKAVPTYEIRIAGRVDEATLTSFVGPAVGFRDQVTVITGQFDQAALHGMLEMIRSLGLDLLVARRIRVSSPADEPGATDPGQHGAVQPDVKRRPR
jgi:hypothetical protein